MADVKRLVNRFYRIGVITRPEDAELIAAGLRSQMSRGWSSAHEPFARYTAVGIVAQQIKADHPSIEA